MAFKSLYLVSIFLFIWTGLTLITILTLAIELDRVYPILPFISDAAATSPINFIFAELFHVTLITTAFIMYIRYLQVKMLCKNNSLHPKLQKLNLTSIIIGYLANVGLTFALNFPLTSAEFVHLTGAAIGFGLGFVYTLLQTGLSYKLYPISGILYILYIRMTICTIEVIAVILFIPFTYLSSSRNKDIIMDINAKLKWSPKDPAWEFHVVATCTQWITAICFMSFMFTFCHDLYYLTVEEPVLKSKFDEISVL